MRLGEAISQYIAYRHALGAVFKYDGQCLTAFARFLGVERTLVGVSRSQVLRFLYGKGPVTSNWHAKFYALRGFYDYAISRKYITSSPLPKKIPTRPPRFVPYIYSKEEMRSLLRACLGYRGRKIDPKMMRTLLLLLYGAGLRIRETIRLTVADVDFSTDCITIRKTKFRKSRVIPFGTQLGKELRRYAVKWRPCRPPQQDDAFFITDDGKPLKQVTVEKAFKVIRGKASVCRTDGARYQPRLHDMRHTFAVRRLISWYRQGADVQALLPVLSTYLGHVNLAATAVYLTMIPELLDQASARFQAYMLQENANE